MYYSFSYQRFKHDKQNDEVVVVVAAAGVSRLVKEKHNRFVSS